MDDKQKLTAILNKLNEAVSIAETIDESVCFPIVDRIESTDMTLAELIFETNHELRLNIGQRIEEIK